MKLFFPVLCVSFMWLLSCRNWSMEMGYSWLRAENWMSVLPRPVIRWKLPIAWLERCGRWASPVMFIRKGIAHRASVVPARLVELHSIPWPRSSLKEAQIFPRKGSLAWYFAALCVSNTNWLSPLPSSFVESQSCHAKNETDLPKRACFFWRVDFAVRCSLCFHLRGSRDLWHSNWLWRV